MRRTWKPGIYPLVVAGYGAVCVYAGSIGGVSMRDWRSLLTLLGMLAGFLGLLWLGPRDRMLEYDARNLDCGMGVVDDETPRNGLGQNGTR